MTEYEYVNTVINALTGVGTVGAVITSLYLAKRSVAPIVKLNISFVFLVNSHHGSMSEQCIQICATNFGVMKENVENYGYSFGVLRWKKRAYIPPSHHPYWRCSFPSTIEPGESARDLVKLCDFDEFQMPLFVDYLSQLPIPEFFAKRFVLNIALCFVRCWVSLSRGGDITVSIGSGLRHHILDRYLGTLKARA